jgi:steroid 5-alpha reductase family enzyme
MTTGFDIAVGSLGVEYLTGKVGLPRKWLIAVLAMLWSLIHSVNICGEPVRFPKLD